MADRIRHGRRAGFIKTAARLAVVLALIAALCAGMAGGAAAAERPERWKVDPESLPESLSAFLDYFCWYGMFGADEFSSSQIGEYNSVMGGQFELCVDFDSYPGEAAEQWIQSDPRGRWGSCYAYDGEKTEWILMNVFNYSSKNILDTRARGDDPSRDYYYEDGTYYVYQGGVGGGFICYPCYAETDGEKYYVNYMIYSGDGYISLDGMGFAVVKPFEADGREYWSLSYWAGQIMELGEAPRELTEVLKGCEGRWVLEDDEASSLTIGAPDGLMTDIGARFSGMAEFSAFALLMDESSMVFFDYDSGFSGWMDLGEDEITMHVIPLPDFWDPSGYGEYFDGPFVFLRASGDVPSGPGSGAFSITPEELERELEIIRSAFYDPTGDDERITLVKGTDGWDYSRDYTFHNGRLVFAFIFDGTEEHRLYFKDDHMIRYID
ncbi:MAG: hypothetical protein IKD79_02170, partial [Oscillospiraceae bacterium]|nr:hypothetical protein [Oscillospiraceae bacterium]